MEDIIKIPRDRIAVLIGTKGTKRRQLERITQCKISVDSHDGDVTLSGDPVDIYNTIPVIKAISRGFNPEIAEELLKEDIILHIVDMKEFIGKNKNAIARIRSRIIGSKGKCRRTIEAMTNCKISIYGKSVGIIGELEMAEIAKEAVENILRGSIHSNVYAWIDSKKKKLLKDHYENKEKP
ncbi:MAG: KH domain-containing protein [Nanoarchaeota archaeon]